MIISTTQKRLEKLKQITKASDRTGWMIDEVAFVMYSLIKFYKPSLVVQIGHLWGKSALISLEALTDEFLLNGERLEKGTLSGDKKFLNFVKSQWPDVTPSKLISVDAFPYGDWKKGISFLKKTYGSKHFEFLPITSDEFFEKNSEKIRKEYSRKCILGIVDGDHSYEACQKDIINMSRLGARHIIVDDIKWLPHIYQVCEQFVQDYPSYSLSTFNAYNGLAVISKR